MQQFACQYVLFPVWGGGTKLQDLACVSEVGEGVHQDEANVHKLQRFLAWTDIQETMLQSRKIQRPEGS